MVLSLTSTLSLFVLIALSTAVFFAAKRFKLPYTVLLVAIGILLVPIVNLPYLSTVFGFLDDLVLTPELLFYIFLPVLIFESGFNMNIRKIVDNAWAISMLAAVSAIISTAVIRSEEHTSELQSRGHLVLLHLFPTRRSSDLHR